MKRYGIMLLCLCCILCGCSSQRISVEELQQQYAQIQRADVEAEVVCHGDEENHSFTVACAFDREQGATTSVLAPKELEGVSARVSSDGLTVLYDGVSLPAGTGREVSAANCLPWLLRAAAEGYVLDYGEEVLDDTNCLRATMDTSGETEKVLCTVWFDAQTLLPCQAELTQDDQVILTVRILSFTWE